VIGGSPWPVTRGSRVEPGLVMSYQAQSPGVVPSPIIHPEVQ